MVPPVFTVTLIFWPGFRFVIPTPALEPEGVGTTFTGLFVVTLKLFAALVGLELGLGLTVTGVLGVAILPPSTTVTLIF